MKHVKTHLPENISAFSGVLIAPNSPVLIQKKNTKFCSVFPSEVISLLDCFEFFKCRLLHVSWPKSSHAYLVLWKCLHISLWSFKCWPCSFGYVCFVCLYMCLCVAQYWWSDAHHEYREADQNSAHYSEPAGRSARLSGVCVSVYLCVSLSHWMCFSVYCCVGWLMKLITFRYPFQIIRVRGLPYFISLCVRWWIQHQKQTWHLTNSTKMKQSFTGIAELKWQRHGVTKD